MKLGILFRSDELSQLTRNGIKAIQQLNLKLICDLRTPNERKSKLTGIPDVNSVRIVNIPIYPHMEDFTQQKFIRLLAGKSGESDYENLIKEYYHRFAFGCTEQINEILNLISDKNNLPALIHCSVGKDRTGYISALIQLLAGVPRAMVLEDYLITNHFIEQRIKRMVRFLRWVSLFRISPDHLKPLLEARSEYLDEVLDEVFRIYGTIEEYLSKACSINQNNILNLKQLFFD